MCLWFSQTSHYNCSAVKSTFMKLIIIFLLDTVIELLIQLCILYIKVIATRCCTGLKPLNIIWYNNTFNHHLAVETNNCMCDINKVYHCDDIQKLCIHKAEMLFYKFYIYIMCFVQVCDSYFFFFCT